MPDDKRSSIVIYFDAATTTGYCVLEYSEKGANAKKLLKYGRFTLCKPRADTLSGAHQGLKFLQFGEFVKSLIGEFATDKYRRVTIGYERGFTRNIKTVECLFGFNAIIRMQAALIADSRLIKCNILSVSPSSVKKHMAGSGTAEKTAVMQKVNEKFGLHVNNDNVSDAIAGADYCCELLTKERTQI